MLNEIVKRLGELEMVKAIALSGSKTSEINDASSDWDIYIYSDERVPVEERRRIFSELMEKCRIDCSPFEEGDECTDSTGAVYDIMYRTLEWTEWQVDDVWRKHNARVGYTTCFLYNIKTSEILLDKDGWFRKLQDEVSGDYPEKLRENIISKNMDVIDGEGETTFLIQATRADKRNDIVSENHRLSAILASAFDALFAYNRVLHPGEKKLMKYAHLLCKELPPSFDNNIENSIRSVGTESYIPELKKLIASFEEFLGQSY